MTRTTLTYTDYAALPDDGRRYERHDGELTLMPSPGTRHQLVTGNLFVTVRQHVLTHDLGTVLVSPLDCILSDTSVVQPDVVFVDAQHEARLSERAIEGSPTLAVEVLSPSSEYTDRDRKLDLCARHGIAYYWIVDPVGRTIEAYILATDTYRLAARLAGEHPAALPPFSDLMIDPTDVWA